MGISTARYDLATPAVEPEPLSVTFPPIILSEPSHVDLVIYRGDTGSFRVTVTDALGVPVNVSSAVWDCDLRADADATTAITSFVVTPVVGDTSSVDISITAAISATLVAGGVWDLQMTLGTTVQTILAGNVTVTKDVSRP